MRKPKGAFMSDKAFDPAVLEKWKSESLSPPPDRAAKSGSEAPKNKKGGGGLKMSGKKVDGGSNQKTQSLPGEIQSQFPDADLSKVTVVLNSEKAKERGVQGFASKGVIQIAPGATELEVMRHEAAHIAQQMKGGGVSESKEDQETDTTETLEEQASSAEDGSSLSSEDTKTADPESTLNSETTNLNDSGAPKLEFNGIKLEKVSGEFKQELVSADWDKRDIGRPFETWWRIPAFPAAGIYVKAGLEFEPGASISAKGTYAWDATKNEYSLTGALEGELKAGVTGYVEGGIGLNLVIQRGGVGIRGSINVEAAAKASKSLSLTVGPDGVNVRDTPMEFELGAAIKAALTARAWTEGWFWDDATEWTFAEFPIATWTGAKAQVSVDFNSGSGVEGRVGTVTPGTFAWGGSPNCTDSNGREM